MRIPEERECRRSCGGQAVWDVRNRRFVPSWSIAPLRVAETRKMSMCFLHVHDRPERYPCRWPESDGQRCARLSRLLRAVTLSPSVRPPGRGANSDEEGRKKARTRLFPANAEVPLCEKCGERISIQPGTIKAARTTGSGPVPAPKAPSKSRMCRRPLFLTDLRAGQEEGAAVCRLLRIPGPDRRGSARCRPDPGGPEQRTVIVARRDPRAAACGPAPRPRHHLFRNTGSPERRSDLPIPGPERLSF